MSVLNLFKVNNKDTRMTSVEVILLILLLSLLNAFTTIFTTIVVFNVNLEQVFVCWEPNLNGKVQLEYMLVIFYPVSGDQ